MKYLGQIKESQFIPVKDKPRDKVPSAQHIELGFVIRDIEMDENGEFHGIYNSDGTVGTLIMKSQSDELFKDKRKEAFKLVDKYQLPLVFEELSNVRQQELREYRKALKDSTINWIHPEKPIWLI